LAAIFTGEESTSFDPVVSEWSNPTVKVIASQRLSKEGDSDVKDTI